MMKTICGTEPLHLSLGYVHQGSRSPSKTLADKDIVQVGDIVWTGRHRAELGVVNAGQKERREGNDKEGGTICERVAIRMRAHRRLSTRARAIQ